MNKLLLAALATVAALSLTACLDEAAPTGDDEATHVDGEPGTPSNASAKADTAIEGRDICEMLPRDDSACAHACDPDALIKFIPEGSCSTFRCTLTDGSEYRIGGCNL